MGATWDALAPVERRVISALARGEHALLSDRTLSRFELVKSSAQEARDRLIRSGDLQRTEGGPVIVDPLLADYARRPRE